MGVISLAGRSYPKNTACDVCGHVMNGAPVQVFVLGLDGDLQFLRGATGHGAADARIIGLDAVEIDRHGLHELPSMVAGTRAVRQTLAEGWEIAPLE